MVFNATFYNISVMLWQSDILVKETGVPGDNNIMHGIHLTMKGIGTHKISCDRHRLHKKL